MPRFGPISAVALLLATAACASYNAASPSDDQPAESADERPESSETGVESADSIDIPGVDEGDQSDPLAHRDDEPTSSGGTPDEAASRPDGSEEGADVETREVEFPGDDISLKGTLHVPAGTDDSPVPGIVLLHGSGPLSRDSAMSGQFLTSFGFEIPVFTELADALASAGYAVLRYDKRTCRESANDRCTDNGYPAPGDDITLDDFAADADRALDWLGDRETVDGDRLVLLGHSQGGTLIPKLMHDRDDVAAGLLVATPHRPIDATYRAQREFMRQMLAKAGMDDARIRSMEAYERISQVADQLQKLRDGDYDEDRLAGAATSFWRTWMTWSDAAPDLAKTLDRPLLVLGGAYDFNVPPVELEHWRQTLSDDGDGPDHRVELIDCVTHSLNCIDESNPFEVRPDDLGRHLHPAVTETLTDFLQTTVPPDGSK